MLKDEVQYRSVLREELSLNMSDEDIRTFISVMEQKGQKEHRIPGPYLPLSSSSSYGADHG